MDVSTADVVNDYETPTPEVLARLRAAGVQVYRTHRDGAVLLDSHGAELTITRWASRATEIYRLDAAP